MKLKFNKLILFIIVVCMFASMTIGCRSNDNIEENIETVEATENKNVVQSTESTNILELETEPTETTEPTEVIEIEETTEEIDEIEAENDANANVDNTYEDSEVVKPTEKIEESTEVITESTEIEIEEELEEGLINLGNFKLTAYCNCSKCCGVWAGGATASGAMPVAGCTIAVDTSVIPMGSSVVINGHTYVAQDTGEAIVGNRIDIYFDTHQEAWNFGVQYADVYLVS